MDAGESEDESSVVEEALERSELSEDDVLRVWCRRGR